MKTLLIAFAVGAALGYIDIGGLGAKVKAWFHRGGE